MSEPPLSNQAKIDRQKNRQKRDKLTRELVVRTLMSNMDGRRYIWLVLEEAHCFHNTFAGENTHVSAFQSGERNFGLKLLNEVMNLTPKEFIQMLQEAKEVTSTLEEEKVDERPAQPEPRAD